MRFKISLILIITSLFLLLAADFAFGFGVSPPRIINDHLIPGAHFEQTIILTQAEPDRPLKIRVVMQAPDIEDWLTLEPGREFTIPEGIQQFPLKVSIDVPKDTAYERYEGEFIVEALTGGEGQVSIITGAVVQLRLRVSGEEYADFKLRGIDVPNIEQGDPVKVKIKLENLGNVKIRPSKVFVRIFDQYQKKLLEKGEAVNMGYVKPFEKGEVIAELPAKLEIGEYWAEVDIYKQEQLLLKDKRYFKVVEKGQLGTFLGLKIWLWGIIVGIILIIIVGFKFGLWKKILAKFGIVIKVEKVQK